MLDITLGNLFRTVGGSKFQVFVNGVLWQADGSSYSRTATEAQERAIEAFFLEELGDDDIVEIRTDPPIQVREMNVMYLQQLLRARALTTETPQAPGPGNPFTPPTITTTTLAGGTEGVAYSQTVVGQDGLTPYTFSVTVGSLPAGLNLDPNTGVISGTPTTFGTSNFTVQLADSQDPQATDTQALSIVVAAAASLNLTTSSVPNATQNTAYNAPLAATGGQGPYSWAVTVGALPTGLTLNPSTGVISGTPTVLEAANFTVTVTDSLSATDAQAFAITVSAPGAVWFSETWDYASQAAMDATAGVGQSGGGGWSEPVTLAAAGPWGTTKALQVTFFAANPWDQPQAGAYKDFPYAVDEFWMQSWLRFDSNWTTLPYWENPPGTPVTNCDHKTWFVYETGFVQRWEFKIGSYVTDASASAGNHDAMFRLWWDPPYPNPLDYDGKIAHENAYPSGRFSPPTDAWDNAWHEVWVHCKKGAGDGEMRIWWDGVKQINAINMDTATGTRQFWRYVFGANRNSGPTEQMGFQQGPVYTYLSNPGWS